MRHLCLFVSFLALASFSGCAKDDGNPAVDSNGACTSATISSYNKLVGRSVSKYTSKSELQSIKNDCASYKGFIGNNTCKAENMSTGQVMTIHSGSVDSVCNAATQNLAWLDGQANSNGNSNGNSSSNSNFGLCNSSVISAYNDVLWSTASLSASSSLASLDEAVQRCARFQSEIGSRTCEASKTGNGSSLWISSSSHAFVCANATSLKAAALKLKAINQTVVSTTKEKIAFTLLRGMPSSFPSDSIVIYQNGRAFLPESAVGIDESSPYCLVSFKFSNFSKGLGRLVFTNSFLPPGDDLIALALTIENPNEENSINCLPGKGKFAKDLTVGELKSIFNSYATIEIGK